MSKSARIATVKRLSADEGTAFLSCGEALTRALIDQRRADRALGWNTGGFVSGYRGSPLGRLDRTLEGAATTLAAHNIVFQPGLNEELAATALYGTQQAALFPNPNVDGVFGLWYAKGPGVDRAGDALKHANFAGTAPKGGVVAVAGDDHEASSSTLAHQSDYAFVAAHIPVLAPWDVQSAYDLALAAIAASRVCGFWIGLKLAGDVAESSATLEVGPSHAAYRIAAGADVHVRPRDRALDQERRLATKRRALHGFVRDNKLDRTFGASDATVGIVAVGAAWNETRAALRALGVDECDLTRHGIRVHIPVLVWPLEPDGLVAFADGLDEIVVIEDKRPLVEGQIKEILFNRSGKRPRVVGKTDESGAALLAESGRLSSDAIGIVLAQRLGLKAPATARLAPTRAKNEAHRTPHYCPGCPHATSTRTPDGAQALAGIGCHTMALWTDSNTSTLVPMGNEGAAWIGLAPFIAETHVFQNLGDGTYVHSGILAVRAAVAANATMTFKLLWNGAVAMTGGQALDATLSVPKVARELAAEGVKRIVVVSERPGDYRNDPFPPEARIVGREAFDAVQDELRRTPGVSVIVYDQPCAAELARKRGHGDAPPPEQRIFINERLCEGCGDCTAKTNCLAVVPVATPFGEKRRIDQDSCTQDLTCLEGLCPAIVTVAGARKRRTHTEIAVPEHLRSLPTPVSDHAPASILIAGVGGRGVVTTARILARAALNDGHPATVLDQTGLAQKGGAVLSHVRIGSIGGRIASHDADLILGLDPLVAAGARVLATIRPGHSRVLLASEAAPTAKGGRDAAARPDGAALIAAVATEAGQDRTMAIAAERIARVCSGRSIAANLVMLGFAFQAGCLLLTEHALLDAIADEGGDIVGKREAFAWGRRAYLDPAALDVLTGAVPQADETLAALIARLKRELVAYQNAALAARFAALVERVAAAEKTHAPGRSGLAEAVARGYYKLLAAKDEYESARLLTSQAFDADLAGVFAEPSRTRYHLALTANGRKIAVGRWARPLLRLLAALKILRGGALDPFRARPIRRLERALIAEYEGAIAHVLARLTASNHDSACAIAVLPDTIRGFGAVKQRSAVAARARQAALLSTFAATSDAVRAAE